eukprot:381814-Hanusia_phi.AAC.1
MARDLGDGLLLSCHPLRVLGVLLQLELLLGELCLLEIHPDALQLLAQLRVLLLQPLQLQQELRNFLLLHLPPKSATPPPASYLPP